MELFHHITVFLISEEEKASFSKAGVEFSEITRGPRGESASFDIGENDPRWQRVLALIASLQGREGMPKEHRVQTLSMTAPTMEENLRQMTERIAAHQKSQPGSAWLNGYSGQSPEELLSLEGSYRIDSLVLAFEEAIQQKAQREGMQSLTDEERAVLAVEALEREVNNGGYDQFFVNSSHEFAPIVVGALDRIGCSKTAAITQRAIQALSLSDVTTNAIEAAISGTDEERRATLGRSDDEYYESAEPIAERLFAFIKAHREHIRF
jgi:hypothetical protein